MAKKRKRLSRKERKRRRREAIERKRRERGWKLQQAPWAWHQEYELVTDMLPLFPITTDTSASDALGMEQILMTLAESGYMADEPEFEEMIVDPMLCLEKFADVVQKLDIEPESLGELSDEDLADARMDILVEVTQRLLTDELRQDILNGLNELRLRLKRTGEREEAAKAAVLQLLLGGDASQELWSLTGLVQAIFARSIYVGLELMQASMEVMGTEISNKDSVSLFERITRPEAIQKADALLKKIPGLGRFLEKQADRIWEEGLEALLKGELYLGLFSEEELLAGFDILQAVFKDKITKRMATPDFTPLEMTEDRAKAVILQVDDYITELMTPKRLELLRGSLNAALGDSTYKKWSPFLYMLVQLMAEEDAVETKKPFLITLFLGEMHAVIQILQQEDDLNWGDGLTSCAGCDYENTQGGG